jgi:starch phosphorylase
VASNAAAREASSTTGKGRHQRRAQRSVLDGWWRGKWQEQVGHGDEEEGYLTRKRDEADSRSLYELLENEIIPLYYDRDDDYVPRRWLRKVKESIRSLAPTFSTWRMVKEYTAEMYVPAALSASFEGNGHSRPAPLTESRAVAARG